MATSIEQVNATLRYYRKALRAAYSSVKATRYQIGLDEIARAIRVVDSVSRIKDDESRRGSYVVTVGPNGNWGAYIPSLIGDGVRARRVAA